MQTLLIIGLIVNSALYFIAVLAVALVTGNTHAALADIAAIGVTYLGYALQIANVPRGLSAVCVAVSVATGLVAGILLLVP